MFIHLCVYVYIIYIIFDFFVKGITPQGKDTYEFCVVRLEKAELRGVESVGQNTVG